MCKAVSAKNSSVILDGILFHRHPGRNEMEIRDLDTICRELTEARNTPHQFSRSQISANAPSGMTVWASGITLRKYRTTIRASRVTLQSLFILLLLTIIFAFPSCASRQQKIDQLATQAQLQSAIVKSRQGYSQQTYSNRAYLALLRQNDKGSNSALHVYLEGDGIPWIQPHLVAVDPTPKTAMALRLMMLDGQASLYLGRPCYHGFYREDGCHPLLWTQARYSERVVSSMADALQSKLTVDGLMPRRPEITLIGYSGGGVIALLLAEHLQQQHVFARIHVVTVAANLDTDAWTRLHHFSRLSLSINPAAVAHRFDDIEQTHIYGEHDDNVPASLMQSLKARFARTANWIAIKQADHVCCWEALWPDLLRRFP